MSNDKEAKEIMIEVYKDKTRVTYDPDASMFNAIVEGNMLSKPSLREIRLVIDNPPIQQIPFERVDGLIEGRNGTYDEVVVTSVSRSQHSWMSYCWVRHKLTKRRHKERMDNVILDTPENRQQLQVVAEAEKARQAAYKRHEEEESKVITVQAHVEKFYEIKKALRGDM